MFATARSLCFYLFIFFPVIIMFLPPLYDYMTEAVMSTNLTMRAVLLMGKPASRAEIISLLKVAEAPRPLCGAKEVLVKVKASSLNIEDIMAAVGRRPLVYTTATADKPVVLGQEFSGVVEEVGSKVKDFKVGDDVLGHKFPFRIRWGTWAEYVAIGADKLVKKPEKYSYAEAAALPMSALVAYAGVNAAGLYKKPISPVKVDPEATVKEVKEGVYLLNEDDLTTPTVAVIGASSTVGSIMVNILSNRGEKVVGICSGKNAESVLRNGAKVVLDRTKGGLELKGDMKIVVVIDAVGGQEMEDMGRKALGSKGHFVTILGPGAGVLGDGTDGAAANIAHGLSIGSRSMKSLFSSVKYTLASMPMNGVDVLGNLVEEGVRAILDSEVDMMDEQAVKDAVEKVREHKARGRVVFVNNE